MKGKKLFFSFHVYYNHAKADIDSFVYWSRLYLTNKFFTEIKNGAHYFSHAAYSKVLLDIEVAFTDAQDGEIGKLYERFRIIGEAHKTVMGKMIEANKEYFYSYPAGV